MRALILGAGISGPNLAIALKKLGWSPILIEGAPKLLEGGAGFSLAPNGLRMLDTAISSSLYQDVLQAGDILKGIDVMEFTGAKVSNMDIDFPGHFGYPLVGIKRHTFSSLAVAHAERLGVPVHFGKRAVSLNQDEFGVEVKFADGSILAGDAVFGCDGIHSVVRRTLFGDVRPTYSGKVTYLGLSTGYLHHKKMMMVIGKDNTFGSYPVGSGARLWFLAGDVERTPEESWTTTGVSEEELAKVKAEYSSWCDPVPEILDGASQCIRWGIFDRPPLTSWHNNRAVLVGDAAHPMTPHLGQGANTALEDVAYLATCFAKYTNAEWPLALRSYDQARIPRTSTIAANARNIGKMGFSSNPVIRLARNSLFKYIMPTLYPKMNKPLYGYTIKDV